MQAGHTCPGLTTLSPFILQDSNHCLLRRALQVRFCSFQTPPLASCAVLPCPTVFRVEYPFVTSSTHLQVYSPLISFIWQNNDEFARCSALPVLSDTSTCKNKCHIIVNNQFTSQDTPLARALIYTGSTFCSPKYFLLSPVHAHAHCLPYDLLVWNQ